MGSDSAQAALGKLVGREPELALLASTLNDALAGSGSLTLLSGPPGIGKTALVERHLAFARDRGALAVAGRFQDVEVARPYAGWVQVLQRLARAGLPPSRPPLRRWLAGAQPDAELERLQLFDMISGHLLQAAAGSGLTVVLEDLQWADTSSLLLLQQLSDDIAASRLQVVATYREDLEQGRPPASQLLELQRSPAARRVTLARLSNEDVLRYLGAAAGDRIPGARRRDLVDWIGGNPFQMTEIARLLEAEGDLQSMPRGLRELVNRRLSPLSREAHDVLRAAAVVGEELEPELLASSSGDALDGVGRALDELCAAGITIGDRGHSFRFAHELVREVVYQEIPPAERRSLHRRVAESMETLWADDLEDHLGELSQQWSLAGSADARQRAAGWARRAGEHALVRLGYDEAVRYFEQALTLGPAADRAAVLSRLAVAQYRAGQIHPCFATCRRMAEIARGRGDARLLAESALVLEGVGDPALAPEIAELCEESLGLLEDGDSPLRARLLGQLAAQLAYTSSYGRVEPVAAQAVEMARRTGDVDAMVSALRSRQFAVSGPDGVRERLSLAEQMIDIGSSNRRPWVMHWGRLWRIDALLQLADMAAVDVEQLELERLADRLQQPLAHWHVARLRAARASLRGDFDEAVALADEARELGRRGGHEVAEGQWMAFRTLVAIQLGDVEVIARMGMAPPRGPLIIHKVGAALNLAALGRDAEAKALFEAAAGQFREHPKNFLWLSAACMLSELAISLGDREVAELLYGRLLPYAGQLPVPGVGPPVLIAGGVALFLGMLATFLDRAEAAARLEESIQFHDRIGAHPAAARSRLEYARVRARQGRRSEAHALSSTALEAATDLGMRPLATEARAVVEATAPVREKGPLSRREAEIARLVAKGLTNKEIATALFLSERTVETHVQNILGKLGFHTRTQVAAWAAARGQD